MKWKVIMQHSLHGKVAASVLLKMLISADERCQTTDALLRMSGTLFSNVNNIQSMIPEDQKYITIQ